MQHSPWEVVILKPTPLFLSFLAAELPDVELPELRLLQIDNTAYAIRGQETEEEIFEEIERHFTLMFQHEIERWLGNDAPHEIEGSFLDFLLCFKFELHSQIVLMEPTIDDAHQLICVKPRSVSIKWMKGLTQEQDNVISVLEQVNLSNLVENATVVIKNFKNLSDVKYFIQHHYQPIVKAEMLRLSDQADKWPQVDTFQEFSRYFDVEIHTQLVHLH